MSLDTRLLGYTGEQLTGVGLGTWAIGGGDWQYGWGRQDDRDSIAAIRRALDVGINWIDTARIYGLGHSEKHRGRRPLQAAGTRSFWPRNADASGTTTALSTEA